MAERDLNGPAGRIERPDTQRDSLYRTLLRSHVGVAALLVLMLFAALAATMVLRQKTLELSTLDAPTVGQAMTCLAGLDQSLAALRGWMLLGDPALKEDRAQAWRKEVRPALSNLQRFSRDWESEEHKAWLNKFTDLAEELYAVQWWIEDVAHTPGNEPAKLQLLTYVRPSADIIDDCVTIIGNESKFRGEVESATVLSILSEMRSSFALANLTLTEFVLTGDAHGLETFGLRLEQMRQKMEALNRIRDLLGPVQQQTLDTLMQEMPAYAKYSQNCIDLRLSNDWNHARSALANEAVPRATQARELLTDIANARRERMRATGSVARWLGNGTLALAAVMFATAGVYTWVASQRRAKHISAPVRALAHATREVASGRFEGDVEVDGPAEVAELSESFNAMRVALQQRETALEQSESRYRELAAEYEELSYRDALTGVANRRAFERALEREWERAQRDANPLGLILLDIDQFKRYNDGYGHQAGDDCLRNVAERLSGQIRAGDLLARYGGEEFVVVLPNADDASVASVAEKLRAAVQVAEMPHAYSEVAKVVTISLGCASVVPSRDAGSEAAIALADDALYRAKEAGRNRFEMASKDR